jgi:hypothetical protein
MKTCVICGARYKKEQSQTKYCSRPCALEGIARRRKSVVRTCCICGMAVVLSGRNGLARANRERVLCSNPLCKSTHNSRTMARTNRKYASHRMTERNPMIRPEVRKKVAQTLRYMGWGPLVRGGNGKPPTPQQMSLAIALSWPTEVPVRTLQPRGSGYPPCYKMDIANPDLMVAVEVDGHSHDALERRAQDRKKEELLHSLGWTVLRFSNQEVTDDLEGCVRTVLSTILRLSETTTISRAAS